MSIESVSPDQLTVDELERDERSVSGLQSDDKVRLGTQDPVNDQGKYKIDIQLMPAKINETTVTARITIMLSGSVDSQNGAVSAFRCSVPTCKKIIDPHFTTSAEFFCPHCRKTGPIEQISEGAMFRGTLPDLARYLHGLWLSANGDASILLRRAKGLYMSDLRQAYLDKNYKLADRLRKLSREKPERVLYPLRNLMKDNLSGMDIRKRIEQFLRA